MNDQNPKNSNQADLSSLFSTSISTEPNTTPPVNPFLQPVPPPPAAPPIPDQNPTSATDTMASFATQSTNANPFLQVPPALQTAPTTSANPIGLSAIDNPLDMPIQQPSIVSGNQQLPSIGTQPQPVQPTLSPIQAPTPLPTSEPAVNPGFAWSQTQTPPSPSPIPSPIPPTPVLSATPSSIPPEGGQPTLSLHDLYGPSQAPTTPSPTLTPETLNPPSGSSPVNAESIPSMEPPSNSTPTQPLPEAPPMPVQESAPEDLSQLIANQKEGPAIYTPPLSQPQTLVTAPAEQTNTSSTEQKPATSIPKWVIGLGVGLLLAVAAASGYFILGVGQNQQAPASAPATNQQVPVTPPKTPKPTASSVPIIVPTSAPEATGSAGFGEINATASANPSALDLLRQRQATGH